MRFVPLATFLRNPHCEISSFSDHAASIALYAPSSIHSQKPAVHLSCRQAINRPRRRASQPNTCMLIHSYTHTHQRGPSAPPNYLGAIHGPTYLTRFHSVFRLFGTATTKEQHQVSSEGGALY